MKKITAVIFLCVIIFVTSFVLYSEKNITFGETDIEEFKSDFRIIEFAKKYEDLISWNIAPMSDYNPVVKLRDGYLTNYILKIDVTESANSTIKFANFCKDNGIEFFYVNAPYKICKIDDAYISGILDFSNQNADNFLLKLKNAGVKYYDFRKILHDEGKNHHKSFYVTDHHWKAETGLWAAKHLLEILRDDYNWNVEPSILDENNFEFKNYSKYFLGSRGKKFTLSRTEPDDIKLIYPKFKTFLNWEMPFSEINTSGDFSITYDMSEVEKIDYYNSNPYAAYNHADIALGKIKNYLLDNEKKILIIHASFFNCVVPFLALGIENVEEIDLRHFKESLKDYILSNKPDVLILAYNCNVFNNFVDWDTHSDIFDFR